MWDRHSSQQNVLDRFCLGKIYSNFVHNEDGIFKFFLWFNVDSRLQFNIRPIYIYESDITVYKSMFYTQVLGWNRFLFLTSYACRHAMHSYKNNLTLQYLRWHLICSNQFYKQRKHSHCESMKYLPACQQWGRLSLIFMKQDSVMNRQSPIKPR